MIVAVCFLRMSNVSSMPEMQYQTLHKSKQLHLCLKLCPTPREFAYFAFWQRVNCACVKYRKLLIYLFRLRRINWRFLKDNDL